MKKGTTIIQFPLRSSDKIVHETVSQPRSLPKHPSGYYDLVIEQCDILVDATNALFDHMKNGDKNSAGRLNRIWKQSDALRDYHLDMLECSSIRTFEFIEISRISVTLDMAIEHTRTIAGAILNLPTPADKFMLKMVGNSLIFVRTLNQALYKLATDPSRIEQDIRVALYQKHQIERTYRLALAALVRDNKSVDFGESDGKQLERVSDICTMFERQNIYRSLYRGCKRIAWIANQIQDMASRSHNQR